MADNTRYFVSVNVIGIVMLIISVRLSLQIETESKDNFKYFYQECSKNSDCPQNYCCIQGMMRYQMPFCSPLGRFLESCHPTGENYREDYSLSFPNNKEVYIKNSWAWMCPCDESIGLRCHTNATCIHGVNMI